MADKITAAEARKELARRELSRRQGRDPAYSSYIFPLSRDQQGSVNWDWNAGLPGMVKRAFTLPGEVMRGDVPVRNAEGNISDEIIGRAGEMAAVVSPTPALRSGTRTLSQQAMRKKIKPPSAMELKGAADKGYAAMRETGVDYSSAAIKQLADEIRVELTQKGFIPENAKTTYKVLDKLGSPPDNSVMGISGLETARSVFGNIAANSADDVEKTASEIVKRKLSGFIETPPGGSVVAGPAARAGRLAQEARGNYAASKRSAQIHGVDEAAGLRAAAANSGQNTGNAIRQKLTTFLLSPKATRGFSPEELKAVEQIIKGTGTQNGLRWLGNVLGGGGGLGMGVTAGMGAAGGAAIGGAPGAAVGATVPPMMGAGTKMFYNRLIRKALASLDDSVRMRSPLYEEMVKQTPAMPITLPNLPSRGLLAAGVTASGQRSGGGGY